MLLYATSKVVSLNQCYAFFTRKMPEREDDHLTPATRLLEKRREMSEVEQALAAQKEVGITNLSLEISSNNTLFLYNLCHPNK